MIYGDWETFFLDNSDRLYHFVVYKKMFTPYEQQQCFSDESVYEEDIYKYGFIREVIPLPDGDLLLGICEIIDDVPSDLDASLDYYKLSELRLSYDKEDIKMFTEETDDEERES